MEPLRVFISGPYSARTEDECLANVQRAIDASLEVWKCGHFPYIPHLTHYVHKRTQELGYVKDYEEYMALDDYYLQVCDAILTIGPSPGADREWTRAAELGLVLYRSIDDLPDLKGEELELYHRIG